MPITTRKVSSIRSRTAVKWCLRRHDVQATASSKKSHHRSFGRASRAILIISGFHKRGYPKMDDLSNYRKNPIKMDDLGVPLLQETTNYKLKHQLSRKWAVSWCFGPRGIQGFEWIYWFNASTTNHIKPDDRSFLGLMATCLRPQLNVDRLNIIKSLVERTPFFIFWVSSSVVLADACKRKLHFGTLRDAPFSPPAEVLPGAFPRLEKALPVHAGAFTSFTQVNAR